MLGGLIYLPRPPPPSVPSVSALFFSICNLYHYGHTYRHHKGIGTVLTFMSRVVNGVPALGKVWSMRL